MTLHRRLETIFGEILGDDRLVLTDETTGADLRGWDSLAHINTMFAIEEEFGIRFISDEFARLDSIGELKQALVRKGVADSGPDD